VSSAIADIVKQFVKLFIIQYGLTFCLSMCTLYEAPLHSLSRLSIRQLNRMSKCYNELLWHWWSSFLFIQARSHFHATYYFEHTAVQFPSYYQWYILIGRQWNQLLAFNITEILVQVLCQLTSTIYAHVIIVLCLSITFSWQWMVCCVPKCHYQTTHTHNSDIQV